MYQQIFSLVQQLTTLQSTTINKGEKQGFMVSGYHETLLFLL